MTSQQTDAALKQRLDFIELDDEARRALRELRPTLSELIGGALDNELIDACSAAIERGVPVQIERFIRNSNRATGAMLSGAIAKTHGHAGLPADTIRIALYQAQPDLLQRYLGV